MIRILLLLMLLVSAPALAVQPDEILADPALEARARGISKELRCLVCRNESIDDSNADLARDLRLLVRERLVAGDSDVQVLGFVTDRYGEYVLLRPSFSLRNALLWFTGPILLLLGGAGAFFYLRGRARAPVHADPLSPEDEDRLSRIVAGEDDA